MSQNWYRRRIDYFWLWWERAYRICYSVQAATRQRISAAAAAYDHSQAKVRAYNDHAPEYLHEWTPIPVVGSRLRGTNPEERKYHFLPRSSTVSQTPFTCIQTTWQALCTNTYKVGNTWHSMSQCKIPVVSTFGGTASIANNSSSRVSVDFPKSNSRRFQGFSRQG